MTAFAPICNPSSCPWGVKAFSGYLGENNRESWKDYDATELVKQYKGPNLNVLIDQGLKDDFYHKKQLLPEHFALAANESGVGYTLRFQEGYDHGYYFISSFIGDHLEHHAKFLFAN